MRTRVVLAISVVYAAAGFTSAQAAVLPKTAELVPAETVVLVDISDFNQFKAKFEKSSIYRLYNDPAMAAFAASFAATLREKIRDNNNLIVKTILDANVLPEGRVVICADSLDWRKPPTVVISQWGRAIDGIKDAFEKTAAKAVERGAGRATEDYCDVNLVTLPEKMCYCFIDDCLIAGTDVETVKFVVARIKGVAGSLALVADLDYVAVMGAVGPYHDIDLYVNLKQLLKRGVVEDTQTRSRMANLGLDNVAGLGCSLGLGEDGSLYGKVFLKTVGIRKGVLKMLETHLGPVKVPIFVPASAYSVSFLNVDVGQAYDELVGIINGFDPNAAMSLQKPLVEPDANAGPGVFLRPDIIEYLGSEIVIAQNVNKPFSTGSMPTESVIAIAVSNRRALEKSLSRLMQSNNPETACELLGHTIYLLGPGGMPFFGGADPAGQGATRMAFTITDTHLILGQEGAVEQAIRTLAGAESESIGSVKWFTAAQSAVPSVVGLAGFEDCSASGDLLWWMLKESAKVRRASMGMGSPVAVLRLQDAGAAVLARPDLWQLGDFGLLPEFDTVRKYFGLSAFYGVTQPDGFLFEFKYLNSR